MAREFLSPEFDEANYYNQLGTTDPTAAMLQSDINRGVLPGIKSEWVDKLSPAQLAKIDRYAWGKQAGIGGLPVVAGYEALKGISQIPAFTRVLPAVARGLGFEDTGNQFQQDKTSSPASLGNVWSYLRGVFD